MFLLELLLMILKTFATIVVILLAFFIQFKRTVWQTWNISQIIIGMPANIICIVYRGYVYSVILDIGLQFEPEISTLEELSLSSLIPRMNMEILFQLEQMDSPCYFQKLLDKRKDIKNYEPQ